MQTSVGDFEAPTQGVPVIGVKPGPTVGGPVVQGPTQSVERFPWLDAVWRCAAPHGPVEYPMLYALVQSGKRLDEWEYRSKAVAISGLRAVSAEAWRGEGVLRDYFSRLGENSALAEGEYRRARSVADGGLYLQWCFFLASECRFTTNLGGDGRLPWYGRFHGDEMPPLMPSTAVLFSRGKVVRSRGHPMCVRAFGLDWGDYNCWSSCVEWSTVKAGDMTAAEQGLLGPGDYVFSRVDRGALGGGKDPSLSRCVSGQGTLISRRLHFGPWQAFCVLGERWVVSQLVKVRRMLLPGLFGHPRRDESVRRDLRSLLAEVYHADREIRRRVQWSIVEQHCPVEIAAYLRRGAVAELQPLLETDPVDFVEQIYAASQGAAEMFGVDRSVVSH